VRLVRGLAALVALLIGVAGTPTALVLLGGNPLPTSLSWSSVTQALLRPDDGSVLIGLVTLVGWVAWVVFAASVVAELVSVFSGSRIRPRLPWMDAPQRLAAGLLLAVLAMAVQAPAASPAPMPVIPPQRAAPQTVSGTPVVSPVRAAESTAPLAPVAETAGTGGSAITHVVQRGDDLWSLAEQYYGQGRDWRRIARANPDVLSGGPDRLQIGWRLAIPGVTPSRARPDTVVVRSGDSLSSIADSLFGDPAKWRALYAANRSQIDDPDEIEVGLRLSVPWDPELEDARPEHTAPPRQRDAHRHNEDNGQERDPGTTSNGPDADPSRAVTPARPASPPTSHPDAPAPTAASAAPATPGASAATAVSRGNDQAPADAGSAADAADAALGFGAVGGLLAAGVLAGLAFRRRTQLQSRPVGRRIVHPAPEVQRVETALGRRQNPLSLRTLDLAIRAVAAHCLQSSSPLPTLVLARVAPTAIELVMTETTGDPPVGFRAVGRSWVLEQDDAGYLTSIPGLGEAARPYPALVSLGQDDDDRQILVNLENMGLLTLDSQVGALSEAVLAAMAVEMSFSLWCDEMSLTLVGPPLGLPDALAKHNVTHTDEVDSLLARLEQRAIVQRAHQAHLSPGQSRIDPDLAEPWAPEVVLINQALSDEQTTRLVQLLTSEPRVTVAGVVSTPLPQAPWTLTLQPPDVAGGAAADLRAPVTGTLHPLGLVLRPQLLERPAHRAMVDLVAVTGQEETTPAPWWDHGGGPPSAPPPDNVTYLGKRFGGWGSDNSEQAKESGVVLEQLLGAGGEELHHPILRLLGPIDLLGAAGTVPPRAGRQCLEYCCWLLEHPGTTAQAMASALVVAEGTRRSNMSRLRAWLGADVEGNPYLPDAYTGRILLHPSVSSDWQRLQILTAAGVNKTSTGALRAALELVRGAPLADAAPGQWHWAEELRTDMVSVIRDIGVEVATRALLDHDIDLARWAAARALVAAPGDELLMAARIRTEHRAGNLGETERLTLQLAAQARSLGVDLDSETVVLLQEVMEGRVRARMA